jgi:hypothetical protein
MHVHLARGPARSAAWRHPSRGRDVARIGRAGRLGSGRSGGSEARMWLAGPRDIGWGPGPELGWEPCGRRSDQHVGPLVRGSGLGTYQSTTPSLAKRIRLAGNCVIGGPLLVRFCDLCAILTVPGALDGKADAGPGAIRSFSGRGKRRRRLEPALVRGGGMAGDRGISDRDEARRDRDLVELMGLAPERYAAWSGTAADHVVPI